MMAPPTGGRTVAGSSRVLARRTITGRTSLRPRHGAGDPSGLEVAMAALRGAARGRPDVGSGIAAAGPLQHHPAHRPGGHGCCPHRHPRRGDRARHRVGADTRRAGTVDPPVRRRNRDLRTVAAQRWTAPAADARPRVPLDRRRRIRHRLPAVPGVERLGRRAARGGAGRHRRGAGLARHHGRAHTAAAAPDHRRRKRPQRRPGDSARAVLPGRSPVQRRPGRGRGTVGPGVQRWSSSPSAWPWAW